MKRVLMFAAAAAMAACSSSNVSIEVANDTDIARNFETVEIEWSELSAYTPESIVVLEDGVQIPSQVIYKGETEPQSLIFQASVEANGAKNFTVENGVREEYEAKAYGRYVPERMDDYAWENNRVAYRLYGPALEVELSTPGIDVWVKSTERLIIDERFKRGNYHHDHGDGMDCYKVGPTLGAGASTPYVNGKLWLSHNYETQQRVDNGPIRTTVKLTYAPFDVDGKKVTATKYISLDANHYFNHMESTYNGDFETLPIAAGYIRHDVKGYTTTDASMVMYEASSDTKHPERDGDIFLAIIDPSAKFIEEADSHAIALKEVKNGESTSYYMGSGWNLSGNVASFDEWKAIVAAEEAQVVSPLKVTVK